MYGATVVLCTEPLLSYVRSYCCPMYGATVVLCTGLPCFDGSKCVEFVGRRTYLGPQVLSFGERSILLVLISEYPLLEVLQLQCVKCIALCVCGCLSLCVSVDAFHCVCLWMPFIVCVCGCLSLCVSVDAFHCVCLWVPFIVCVCGCLSLCASVDAFHCVCLWMPFIVCVCGCLSLCVSVDAFHFVNFHMRTVCPVECQNGATFNEVECTCSCADGYTGTNCESMLHTYIIHGVLL